MTSLVSGSVDIEDGRVRLGQRCAELAEHQMQTYRLRLSLAWLILGMGV